MSAQTPAEESLTWQQLRDQFEKNRVHIDKLRTVMSDSTGTHVAVEFPDGRVRAYLLTDLPLSSLRVYRVGSVSITIPANADLQSAVVTLSPALDATANYKAFASVNAADSTVWSARSYLGSVSLLRLTAFRNITPGIASNTTGVTVAGTDLTGVTQPAGTEHGSDLGDPGLGHGHNTLSHPVTDPGHVHSLSLVQGATTVNVDWMLVHV